MIKIMKRKSFYKILILDFNGVWVSSDFEQIKINCMFRIQECKKQKVSVLWQDLTFVKIKHSTIFRALKNTENDVIECESYC